jgi:hypothetical protein
MSNQTLIFQCRTIYVANVGAEMLDNIEHSPLSIAMTGDGLAATTWEDLEGFLNEYDSLGARVHKVYPFLEQTFNDIIALTEENTSIGDVVFVA